MVCVPSEQQHQYDHHIYSDLHIYICTYTHPSSSIQQQQQQKKQQQQQQQQNTIVDITDIVNVYQYIFIFISS